MVWHWRNGQIYGKEFPSVSTAQARALVILSRIQEQAKAHDVI